ncbi:MAG: transposase family protein [Halioglobus sp.]
MIKASRPSFYRWYFLSTIQDDYSRYIIVWRLTTSTVATDVTDTLEDALKATGLSEARVRDKPRLLLDNGPFYISSELKSWLKKQEVSHSWRPVHGKLLMHQLNQMVSSSACWWLISNSSVESCRELFGPTPKFGSKNPLPFFNLPPPSSV